MKKIGFISCGLGLLLLVATVFAADKKQPTLAEANATIQQLTEQIDKLQTKMKDMEQRLVKVEEAQKAPPVTFAPVAGGSAFLLPGNITTPHVAPQHEAIENYFADPNHPPKIWGEGQINGWKFYTIPVSSNERETAELIPVSGK